MPATASKTSLLSNDQGLGEDRLLRCNELGDALQRMALLVDGLLQSDVAPRREEVRTLRLLANEAIRALGAVVREVNCRRWEGSIDVAFPAMAADFAEATGALSHVRIRGPIEQLPDDVAAALRSVVIEALTNVSRYARASFLVLTLDVGEAGVTLDLVDDGVGLVGRQVPAWDSSVDLGLRRMNRTMHAVGGAVAVHRLRPRGMRLRITAPCDDRRCR